MIDPNQQLVWNYPTPETAINASERTIDDALRAQGLVDDEGYPVDEDDIRGEDFIEGGDMTSREELEELIADLRTLLKRGRASAMRDEDRISGNRDHDDHPGHLISPVLNFDEISKSRTAHTAETRDSVINAQRGSEQTPGTPGHLVAPMPDFAEISRRR